MGLTDTPIDCSVFAAVFLPYEPDVYFVFGDESLYQCFYIVGRAVIHYQPFEITASLPAKALIKLRNYIRTVVDRRKDSKKRHRFKKLDEQSEYILSE